MSNRLIWAQTPPAHQVKMIRLDCHLHVEGQGLFPKEFLYFFDENRARPDEKSHGLCSL